MHFEQELAKLNRKINKLEKEKQVLRHIKSEDTIKNKIALTKVDSQVKIDNQSIES